MSNIAIVGASGAVGLEILTCLEQRNFPVDQLRLLGSTRSAGKKFSFHHQELILEELTETSFKEIDIAFFSAGSELSKKYAPIAVQAGATVIDNSSAFRMDPTVPLIVPEINIHKIDCHRGIIANPNCSTIIALTPLWPIYQKNKIKRLIISTYQAASGAGKSAMQELLSATNAYLQQQDFVPEIFPHSYAFNLFSHNSHIDLENGYNEEELKMIYETQKIFNDPEIRVSATCIRVPVLRAHSESIYCECEGPISPKEIVQLLQQAKGVKLINDIEKNYFPMPIDASGQGDILVGRIRQDMSDPSGKSISMFVSGDQLLKGAALNAVQIAECL